VLNRRQFLFGTGAVLGAASLAAFFAAKKTTSSWLVSAFSNGQQQHFAGAFDLNGQLINAVRLPGRGHGVLAHPSKPGHAIVYARRPGDFLLEVDFINGVVNHHVSAETGYHFFGHGAFSHDGQRLMSVENHFAKSRGEIVIRDALNYQVIGRYDCEGIGPHECKLLPNSNTLVIANGGIKTHPNWPRQKLNLETMSPALSYLDLNNGQIIDHFRLDNHRLSIRHLDISSSGKVVAGLQYQGPKSDIVPLAISHHGQSQLSILQASDDTLRPLNQYAASVCINEANNQVAISCPRGDQVTFWDLDTDRFSHKVAIRDVAGLSINQRSLIATNGKGQSWDLSAAPNTRHAFNDIRWDNHLTTLNGM